MKMKYVVLVLILGALVVGGLQTSFADPGSEEPLTVSTLTADADYVIQGVVKSVDYVMLPQEGSDTSIPFTLVTLTVEKKLKGTNLPDEVTLRFQGGPIPGQTIFVHIADSPLFRIQDRDILFVKGNGVEPIPLVGQSAGRLRIVQDELLTEFGHQLALTGADSRLEAGALTRPEVHATKLPNGELFMTKPQPRAQADAPGVPLVPERLIEKVNSVIEKLPAGQKGPVPAERISVKSDQKVPPLPQPTPPKSNAPKAKAALSDESISPKSKAELEQLKKNRGNPVIRKD